MLVLSRKKYETIEIGRGCTVAVVDIRGDKVRLGVEAPTDVPIHRGEVANAIRQARRSRMVIGLVGYAGAGKDTAADELVNQGWGRMAFADPLRESLLRLDPVVELDNGTHGRLARIVKTWGWGYAKRHADVRRLLQRMGTEVVRDLLGADTWVDLLRARLANHQPLGQSLGLPLGQPVVVTDVRFPNEVRLLREEFGARLIRVVRPGVGPVNEHISDQVGAMSVDGEVLNDDSPSKLCRRVLDCVRTFVEEGHAA